MASRYRMAFVYTRGRDLADWIALVGLGKREYVGY